MRTRRAAVIAALIGSSVAAQDWKAGDRVEAHDGGAEASAPSHVVVGNYALKKM